MGRRLRSSLGQAHPLGGTGVAPQCRDKGQALGQARLNNGAGPTPAGPQATLGTEQLLPGEDEPGGDGVGVMGGQGERDRERRRDGERQGDRDRHREAQRQRETD